MEAMSAGRQLKTDYAIAKYFRKSNDYWGLSPLGEALCKIALQQIAKGPDEMSAKLAKHALKLNEEGDWHE